MIPREKMKLTLGTCPHRDCVAHAVGFTFVPHCHIATLESCTVVYRIAASQPHGTHDISLVLSIIFKVEYRGVHAAWYVVFAIIVSAVPSQQGV